MKEKIKKILGIGRSFKIEKQTPRPKEDGDEDNGEDEDEYEDFLDEPSDPIEERLDNIESMLEETMNVPANIDSWIIIALLIWILIKLY